MQSMAAREPLTVAHDDSAQDDLLAAVDLPAIERSPSPSPRRVPSLETGVVRGTASGLVVELGGGPVAARRAKSCLVAPDAGDRVLCAVDGEQVFVLAVLEGEAGATTRIVAEGDMKVQATGRLGLGAGDQIEIAAAREVGLFAGKLQVRAQAAAAAIEEIGLVGRSLEAHFQKAVVVAERMEARADRLVQRAKQAFRFVEALEQVRAGVFDLRAEGLAAVRGENTIVAARTLAKLDGEQVKIG
ncbi:DUF3540 domain-containing protein [Sorangium sp. So ce204]|uniref:DUF3540 domain-containing protein n=1 Tax=Sorangium sp. So ce204 TaxID=3133288 RepID=UPI003F6221F5